MDCYVVYLHQYPLPRTIVDHWIPASSLHRGIWAAPRGIKGSKYAWVIYFMMPYGRKIMTMLINKNLTIHGTHVTHNGEKFLKDSRLLSTSIDIYDDNELLLKVEYDKQA